MRTPILALLIWCVSISIATSDDSKPSKFPELVPMIGKEYRFTGKLSNSRSGLSVDSAKGTIFILGDGREAEERDGKLWGLRGQIVECVGVLKWKPFFDSKGQGSSIPEHYWIDLVQSTVVEVNDPGKVVDLTVWSLEPRTYEVAADAIERASDPSVATLKVKFYSWKDRLGAVPMSPSFLQGLIKKDSHPTVGSTNQAPGKWYAIMCADESCYGVFIQDDHKLSQVCSLTMISSAYLFVARSNAITLPEPKEFQVLTELRQREQEASASGR